MCNVSDLHKRMIQIAKAELPFNIHFTDIKWHFWQFICYLVISVILHNLLQYLLAPSTEGKPKSDLKSNFGYEFSSCVFSHQAPCYHNLIAPGLSSSIRSCTYCLCQQTNYRARRVTKNCISTPIGEQLLLFRMFVYCFFFFKFLSA